MIKIAKNHLKIKTNNIYIQNAKNAIKILNEKKQKFDLILIDIY
jgi:tRNA G26 N,N-dimethylase Trm1